jgi:ABC-2 type transport system permease protein
VRWLFLKDLQILRRSPLLVGLLVIYPVAIGLVMGFAIKSKPQKPKVAFLSQVPRGQGVIDLGSSKVDATKYASQLFQTIDRVSVHSRAEAVAKVRSGEAQAGLIVPPDIVQKLATGLERPTVEVILNIRDPLVQQSVDAKTKSALADANQALSAKLTQVAAGYISLLLSGGEFDLFGQNIPILGLRRSRDVLQASLRALPARSPERAQLERVIRFATLAIDNLNLSTQVLRSVASPVQVKRTELAGRAVPIENYAVTIAVVVSLMLITVLLAAGMLALEREEHAYARLVRGLISREGLLGEKIALAGGAGAAVVLVMVVLAALFVSFGWSRFGLWVLALVGGGLGFAALGVAIGALAREVRAASLLALLLSLPLAFLALVPASAVSGGLHAVLSTISALFPFKPALQALSAALDGTAPGIGVPLLHLLALTAAFGLVARLGLRRFGG